MTGNQQTYEDYLADIHTRLVTRESVIGEVLNQGLGRRHKEIKRITAGEVNEVYDVILEDGLSVILRIAHKQEPDFLQEQWAINQCQKLGVPVPEILLITNRIVDGRLLSFCVQGKIEGDPLERGAIDFRKLDRGYLQRIMGQAGEYLAKIHTVPTQGFGEINDQGKGESQSLPQLIRKSPEQRQGYYNMADKEGFHHNIVEQILEVLEKGIGDYANVEPKLNHGDYGPKHIMVKGESLTGILDWGDINGNSPVYEFARWDYWYGSELPLEWLRVGYGNEALFDADFSRLFNLFKLNIGLDVWWYSDKSYQAAVERAKKQLLDDWAAYRDVA